MKYWLRLRHTSPSPLGATQDLETARDLFVAKGVQVLEGGLGVGGSVWLVLADDASTVLELRRKLGGLSAHVEHVEHLRHLAEATTLGRQLRLFH